MVPTLDKDPSRRYFGRDFLHALPFMWQPPPLYLRRAAVIAYLSTHPAGHCVMAMWGRGGRALTQS